MRDTNSSKILHPTCQDSEDASLHTRLQGLGLAGNEAPDGPLLPSPFTSRIASPQASNEAEGYIPDDMQFNLNDLTPPAPAASPDRNLHQPPSSTGKIAYVVFGDRTTGIYYNWSACEHKLNGYVQAGSWKPKYYGYTTYNEATVAWAFYLETRIVPFAPADGGVLATPVPSVQPMTPQRNRNRFPNIQGTTSRSPYNSPSSPHHGSPSPARVASSPARASGHITTTPLPLYSQSPPLSQPRLTVVQQVEETSFFIVIIGYVPGVYVSLHLALHATSDLFSESILEAASRNAANQVFVDAYMTDRVRRL